MLVVLEAISSESTGRQQRISLPASTWIQRLAFPAGRARSPSYRGAIQRRRPTRGVGVMIT